MVTLATFYNRFVNPDLNLILTFSADTFFCPRWAAFLKIDQDFLHLDENNFVLVLTVLVCENQIP